MAAQIYQYPSLYHSPNKSEPDTQADQTQFHPYNLIHTFSLQRSSSKIKSSLCKNFSLKGYCPYGTRCQFAHGPQQLRCNQIANTCYKTKPCFSFLKKGQCPYGHRCNFIHKEEENLTKNIRSALLQNFAEFVVIGKGGDESRLLKKLALQ